MLLTVINDRMTNTHMYSNLKTQTTRCTCTNQNKPMIIIVVIQYVFNYDPVCNRSTHSLMKLLHKRGCEEIKDRCTNKATIIIIGLF